MAIREILHFPDPRLRNRAEPVAHVDDGIRRLVDDMLETMYAAPGIGLAAIQVNVPKRIVTIDISEHGDEPLCLINPEILELAGSVETESWPCACSTKSIISTASCSSTTCRSSSASASARRHRNSIARPCNPAVAGSAYPRFRATIAGASSLADITVQRHRWACD
jgi:hypothetical protein